MAIHPAVVYDLDHQADAEMFGKASGKFHRYGPKCHLWQGIATVPFRVYIPLQLGVATPSWLLGILYIYILHGVYMYGCVIISVDLIIYL